MSKSARSQHFSGVVAFVALLALSQVAPASAQNEDYTIAPGNHIGALKLGMKQGKITAIVGNDGAYSLVSGIKVVLSQWKEPETTWRVKIFYDSKDRAVQIASAIPQFATPEGISLGSTVADVKAKYPDVELQAFRDKGQNIYYYDDVKRGVAFKFTQEKPKGKVKAPKSMRAILIHWPGNLVIPDTDETTVE